MRPPQVPYNLRFPGQYYMAETGLNQNYFGDLDPLTGKYIESDPIGLMGGTNTYAYTLDAPTMNSDPKGLEAVSYMMHHLHKYHPQTGCPCAARLPDFAVFQFDLYVASITATYTRDGDIFLGKGVSRGYLRPYGWGGSLSAGWYLRCNPTRDDLNNFLISWSSSAGVYDGVGGAISANQNGAALMFGLGDGISTGGWSPGIINSYSGNMFGDNWK